MFTVKKFLQEPLGDITDATSMFIYDKTDSILTSYIGLMSSLILFFSCFHVTQADMLYKQTHRQTDRKTYIHSNIQ